MVSADRTQLVQFTTPLSLRDKYTELLSYSNKQFNTNKTWFTAMVKKYGKVFLESDSGKAWLSYRADAAKLAEKGTEVYVGDSTTHIVGPETVEDLFHLDVSERADPDPNFTGLHWTRYNAIDFYKKYLLLVETEPTEDERLVGWLADDPDNFWLNALSQVALEAILFWVQHEGPCSGGLKQGALGAFVSQGGFNFEGQPLPKHSTRRVPSEVTSDNTAYEHYEALGKNNLGTNMATYTAEALATQPSEESDLEDEEDIIMDDELAGTSGVEDGSESQHVAAAAAARTAQRVRRSLRRHIGLGTDEAPFTVVPPAPKLIATAQLSLGAIMDGDLGLGMENDDIWTEEEGLNQAIAIEADEESTRLANNLSNRLENVGMAHTRQQIFINSITVPQVVEPGSRETGVLFANSNIFGQLALMRRMLKRRVAFLSSVYGTMRAEMEEIAQRQAELDAEEAKLRKALLVTAEFNAQINAGKEQLAATEGRLAALSHEHVLGTGLPAVAMARSGTMKKPCDSRGSIISRFGRKLPTHGGASQAATPALPASSRAPTLQPVEPVVLSSPPGPGVDDEEDPFK